MDTKQKTPRNSHKVSLFGWIHYLFIDHAIIRLFYNNFYQVAEGVYRSSQPLPIQFRRLKRKGIKTIINLRGGSPKNNFYILEKEACEKNAIELIDFSISSSKLMNKNQLHNLKQLFQTVEYPILIHCKSGADRAGIVATLYNMMILKKDYPQANQLKWYYGHLVFWSTGILDHFFADWMTFQKINPTVTFEEWIEKYYSPETLKNTFYINRWGEWFARKILRRE